MRRGTTIVRSYTVPAPPWAAPSVEFGSARLRFEILALEWVGIGGIVACLSLVLRRTPRDHAQGGEEPEDLDERDDDETDVEAKLESTAWDGASLSALPTVGSPDDTEEYDPESLGDGSARFLGWFILVIAATASAAYNSHLRSGSIASSDGPISLDDIAYAFGAAASMLFLPVLVSFLFRKRLRFAIRFVGLSLLALSGWLVAREEGRPIRNFMAEVEKRHTALGEQAREQLVSKGYYSPNIPMAEEAMGAVREQVAELPDNGRAVGEALWKVNEQMLALAKGYESAQKRYFALGGADPSTIRTLEELDSRRLAAEDLGRSNREFLSFMEKIDSHLYAALAGVTAPSFDRAEAIRNYKRGAKVDSGLRIRELDKQFVEHSLEVLALLRREWGSWRVGSGSITFERDSAVSEYNRLMALMEKVGEEQTVIQRRVFD